MMVLFTLYLGKVGFVLSLLYNTMAKYTVIYKGFKVVCFKYIFFGKLPKSLTHNEKLKILPDIENIVNY